MTDLTRHSSFIPGYDKRDTDPSKNYGISGGRFIFVVSGPLGAVHFVCGANFYPGSAMDHLARHYHNDASALVRSLQPTGYDVGYHSHTPEYDGQEISQESCEWLGGKPCYSDGSGLRAAEWMEKFMTGGTEWLWPALENEYAERFTALSKATGERE